jgi:hypothetical protein
MFILPLENTKQATFVLEKLTSLTQQVRDRLGEPGDRPDPPPPPPLAP